MCVCLCVCVCVRSCACFVVGVVWQQLADERDSEDSEDLASDILGVCVCGGGMACVCVCVQCGTVVPVFHLYLDKLF